MRLLIDEGGGRRPVAQMTYPQTRQAAAIMDAIGRLIPQEGVDYDVELTFKGENNPSVSMSVIPLTDKGSWWKDYVVEMIRKYPPRAENPPQAIQEDPGEGDAIDEEVDDQAGE